MSIDQTLLEIFRDQTGPFFFVGSGKNAGKSTFLNRVNRVLSKSGVAVGVTTIGHDGEPFDAILGHAKPPVEIFRGNLVCLTERMAADAGAVLESIEPAGHETAVGKLVFARCAQDGSVEILGPETNAKCLDICGKMAARGARIILVDGAYHRRTQVAVLDRTSLALIISGDVGFRLSEIGMLARHLAEIFRLPRADGDMRFPDELGAAVSDNGDVRVRGPLTEALAHSIMEKHNGARLFIEDATKIFCEPAFFDRLRARMNGVFVSRSFKLKMIGANPTARTKPGFPPPAFAETIKRAAPDLPVIDVVAELML